VRRIKNFQEFNEGVLNESWPSWNTFWNWLVGIFKKTEDKDEVKPTPIEPPKYLTGQHMIYIPHQQGSLGASVIYQAARGKSKMSPQLREKLAVNVPTGSSYYKTIKDPKSSDKSAAIAYLQYYNENWERIKNEANALINRQEYKKVKEAIDKIQNPTLPKEFLYTVAFKESSLRENPGTKKYVGLFQIGPLAWAELKRVYPNKYKGSQIPKNLSQNAQAGHDYLSHIYEKFKKKIESIQSDI
jgi:hypothetical protein